MVVVAVVIPQPSLFFSNIVKRILLWSNPLHQISIIWNICRFILFSKKYYDVININSSTLGKIWLNAYNLQYFTICTHTGERDFKSEIPHHEHH